MSDKSNHLDPDYATLGSQLRSLRKKRSASLVEVSGAIEIDERHLSQIELGKKRPSEDILMLLISYFAIPDTEASTLWTLAGYSTPDVSEDSPFSDTDTHAHAIMVMPVDARIVYTDMVHVIVNDYGVMLNFMQSIGMNNQPLAVSRIGMSREHAKSLLTLLQKTLAQSEPKSLPAPKNKPYKT